MCPHHCASRMPSVSAPPGPATHSESRKSIAARAQASCRRRLAEDVCASPLKALSQAWVETHRRRAWSSAVEQLSSCTALARLIRAGATCTASSRAFPFDRTSIYGHVFANPHRSDRPDCRCAGSRVVLCSRVVAHQCAREFLSTRAAHIGFL